MMRRNHMLVAISAVSLALNLLFLHYFSSLQSAVSNSVECPDLLIKNGVNNHKNSNNNNNNNQRAVADYDNALEQLIHMQITSGEEIAMAESKSKVRYIPRLSRLVDNYIKQKLIFIVGSMSSGTTLVRLILDTHPEINCGDETKIIELMLSFVEKTNANDYFVRFMASTGIRNSTVEKATALFIYYVMENNFKTQNLSLLHKVKYLCNKEPMNTYYIEYMHKIFPRARFLYVLRDGRDMTYSYMRRNHMPMVFKEFQMHITNWNRANQKGIERCRNMGEQHCMVLKYETLVSNPEETVKMITKFLGVEFSEDMLHHDEFLKSEKLSLTKVGFINQGVQRSGINNSSVGSWRNKIEGYNEAVIAKEITLLKQFNYI